MLRIDSSDQEIFNSVTFQVSIPEGTMFVNILEDTSGKPCAIDATVGKAGTSIRAWTHSFSRIATLALEHGVTIDELISELSSQSSDKSIRNPKSGIIVHSGPEGICHALMEYKRDKFQKLRSSLGVFSDEEAEHKGRKGRFLRSR
jgi:hypothetical protein